MPLVWQAARAADSRPLDESMAPGAGTASADVRRYRADIDGLRAVAIALVVAFHFRVPGVDGGYLGVDLFFVISGFLIASIFERHEASSLAGLADFYARRVKRLMPAFLVVGAATIAAATLLLLPEDYDDLLKSVRDSLAFSANRFFARETTGYFAANAAQMPWLHTWSLSIEWQFYFVFPLVYVAVARLRTARNRSIAWAALVVGGAALSIAMVARDAPEAYFSAAARFFEFLLGALATQVPASPTTRRIARWFPFAGVAALVALALAFDAATPFPGLPALWVCLVGFGLIVTGSYGSPLAHPVFAWIGKRSYSIYLWHWPVVAFADYVQHTPSALETVVSVAAVVAIADVTYRFVERPGMRLSWRPMKTVALGCVLPFVSLAAFTLFARHLDDLPGRLGPEAQHAHATIERYLSHDADRCHDYRDLDIEPCAFGDLAASRQALMIGDSHARHFRPFMQVLAADAHVKVYGLTNSECPTLEGSADRGPHRFRDACAAATARDFALVRSGRFRYVILAERWIGYTPDELEGLDRSLSTIVAANATPVIFASVAEDGTDTKDCFYHHIKIRAPFVEDCFIHAGNEYQAAGKRYSSALLRSMQIKYPSLIVIDPQAVQCHAGLCETFVDGTPIYADLHHLNGYGSTILGRAYLERFGDPFVARGG